MKKLFTIILIVSIFQNIKAQSPGWAWALSAGGDGDDYGVGVASDANRNVYVFGTFAGDSINFGNTTLFNNGTGADVFLVKYSPAGNVLWAKAASGNSDAEGFSVATDANGNIYVTGFYDGATINFGSNVINNTDVTGNSFDIFIVKYDPSGNVIWAASQGGIGNDVGQGITTDANGNLFVTGYYASPVITIGTTTLTNTGSADFLLLKYDSIGTVLWATTASGNSIDVGKSVSTDANGNAFITGQFKSDSLRFGTSTLGNVFAGTTDVFLLKYSSSGTLLWATSAGGSANDYGNSVSSDAGGNVYLAGNFNSASIMFGTTTLTNAGASDDLFISKYSSNGTVLWASSAGGSDNDVANSIVADASGNVYLAGDFESSTITFDTTTLINTGSEASTEIYLVKYSSNGTVLWVSSAAGGFYDNGKSVCSNAAGDVFVTGDFNSQTLDFGINTLNHTGNIPDVFVAKIDGLTGIAENYSPPQILIYPNPASSIFIVNKGNGNSSEIEIQNIIGKLIYKTSLTNQETVIDLSNEEKGIYFIMIKDNNQKVTNRKIIIQ